MYTGEFGDVGGLPTAVGKKIEGWIVSGLGDADLRVGDGHFAFSFGDVRATLKQIGRQTGVESRRLHGQFA